MSPTIGVVAGSFRRGGGGGGGITAPTDIANLALWFKADAGVSTSGSAVTAWADQSGNGRDVSQATGTQQPVLTAAAVNGLPAITFDGTADNLAGTLAFSSPRTVLAVRRLVSSAPAQNQTVLGEWSTIDASRRSYVARRTGLAPLEQALYVDPVPGTDAWSGMNIGGTSIPLDTWAVIAMRNDGAAGTVDHYYRDASNSYSSLAVAAAVPTTMNSFWIGKAGATSGYFKGHIAEVLVYDRVLTDTELTWLRNYLGVTRYAIHATIP